MQPHVTFLSIYIFSWKWRAVWVSEVATDSRWLYLITGAFDLWVRISCLRYLHHNYINRTQHFRAHIYVLALKRMYMIRTQLFRAHIYVTALKGCSLHILYIFSILMTILSDDLLIRISRNGFSIKLMPTRYSQSSWCPRAILNQVYSHALVTIDLIMHVIDLQ